MDKYLAVALWIFFHRLPDVPLLIYIYIYINIYKFLPSCEINLSITIPKSLIT